jgi:predicted DCC family thiol-disulfide oxidoreductase YuxK
MAPGQSSRKQRVQSPVLFYDGLCGACNRTVQFILARDPGGTMKFAPLQGDTARRLLDGHPGLRHVDSLVFLDAMSERGRQRILTRSGAVLAVAKYLGWPWRVVGITRLVPRALRDWAYDIFARYRYRVFGHYDTCPIPSPETRKRFLP